MILLFSKSNNVFDRNHINNQVKEL